jgi:hypothetical protein
LEADDSALDRLQQGECQNQGQCGPDGEMQPHRDLEPGLRREYPVPDQVSDDKDDEIRGQVVGAVVVKFGSALRALVHHFKESAEQAAPATGRTAAERTASHGGRHAWRNRGRGAGPEAALIVGRISCG